MIINGEKVPAFSATTLSIPKSPNDNLEEIIKSSRALYSRPRKEVEDEIRETIEQSEKYKKELSDSGRQDESPAFFAVSHALKPQKRPATAKESFKKQKISPNTAEEKTGRLGLKDLGRLAEEATKKEKAKKASKKPEKKQGTKPEPKKTTEKKAPEPKKSAEDSDSTLTINHDK